MGKSNNLKKVCFYRSLSRDSLKNKWRNIIIISTVYLFYSVSMPIIIYSLGDYTQTENLTQQGQYSPLLVISIAIVIVYLIFILPPIVFGVKKIALEIARKKTVSSKVFSEFKNYKKIFVFNIYRLLNIFLWVLPVIVMSMFLLLLLNSAEQESGLAWFAYTLLIYTTSIGIIIVLFAYIRYQVVYYYYLDNLYLRPMLAFEKGRGMIKGKFKSLILLYMSFFGWFVLSGVISFMPYLVIRVFYSLDVEVGLYLILTIVQLFIQIIAFAPLYIYAETSIANFYRDLVREITEEPAKVVPDYSDTEQKTQSLKINQQMPHIHKPSISTASKHQKQFGNGNTSDSENEKNIKTKYVALVITLVVVLTIMIIFCISGFLSFNKIMSKVEDPKISNDVELMFIALENGNIDNAKGYLHPGVKDDYNFDDENFTSLSNELDGDYQYCRITQASLGTGNYGKTEKTYTYIITTNVNTYEFYVHWLEDSEGEGISGFTKK